MTFVALGERGLTAIILVLLLVLPCPAGFALPYLLLAVVVLLLGTLLLQRGVDWSPDPMAWLFLSAFALLFVLFSITADEPGDPLSAFNFAAFLVYLPLAVAFRRRAATRNTGLVAWLCLAGALAGLAFGLVQIFVFATSVGAISSDYIRVANSGLILGFLAPALGWHGEVGSRRWLLLLGPLAAIALVIVAGARIAMVATPVLIVVLALLLVRRKWLALLAAIASVAVVVGLALLAGGPRVAMLIGSIGSVLSGSGAPDEAVRIRLLLYGTGWQAFLASPLVGYGWANMMPAVGALLPPGESAQALLPHLHNDLLNFAVFGGLAGAVLYIVLLAAPAVLAWRSPRDSQWTARIRGTIVLVSAYLVMGVTDTMLSFETHTALFVGLVAVLLVYCRDPMPERPHA